MPGARPGPIAGHPGDDVGDVTIAAEREAERVPGRDACASSALLGRRRLRAVLKPVADAAHEVERQGVDRPAHPLGEERRPVVGSCFVQVPDDLGKVERDDIARRRILAQELPAEVVEAPFPVGLLADDRIGVEPEQRPLEVEVLTAPQLVPVRAAGTEQMGGHRGVLERAPLPAGPEHQPADGGGEGFAIVLRADQSAADHEQLAQVLGQPLVDPEQRGAVRGVEIRDALAAGPAILAAPGMDIFMRDEVGDPAFAVRRRR